VLGYSLVADRILDRIAPDWWLSVGPIQYLKMNDDPVPVTCALGQRFVEQSESAGFRPVFVLQYPGDHIVHGRPDDDEKILDCFAAQGIQVIDTYDTLREAFERSAEEFQALYQDPAPTYGHMTARGNQLVAERVAATLSISH
jgi:hypothetical protein